MDISDDGQSRAFYLLEDNDGKLSLLFQFGKNTRYFEVRIDFPFYTDELIRLLGFKLP
jgi:hypothetical protein